MITETGAWNLELYKVKQHNRCDEGLTNLLCNYVEETYPSPIIYDFGCATGEYVNIFINRGLPITGIDGNPYIADIPNCIVADLTAPLNMVQADFILCLEVGEHIPATYEKAFINNLVTTLKTGGTLALSWAIPGQGGYGHYNEKSNEYIINTLAKHNLVHQIDLTKKFREGIQDVTWLKTTLMIFKKI